MRIKKKDIQSEIFTGSMADISFLLIIYFMITSAFSTDRGLDFALPEDTQTPEIKQEDSIDVHVLRGGAIEVDGTGLSLEGLLPYVADKLKQNPDKPVILRTDPDATYGDMIRVFDELRQAPDKIDLEIKTISIPTRREIENLWSMLGIQ
ncbi:MAG: biopolymer transporter ExbD [Thermoanaerobaculales bacterium]|jgi:biopolymer transport protein ExbD|nr:biopolymer transporter ExbD [Thermoanaerobaculales bacterium]